MCLYAVLNWKRVFSHCSARRNTKWRKTKPSDLDNPKNNRALQSFLGTMGENRFPV